MTREQRLVILAEIIPHVSCPLWDSGQVQTAMDRAVRMEREACAQTAEDTADLYGQASQIIANTIRAREDGKK